MYSMIISRSKGAATTLGYLREQLKSPDLRLIEGRWRQADGLLEITEEVIDSKKLEATKNK